MLEIMDLITISVLCLILSLTAIILTISKRTTPCKLPPGPKSLPLIGNLLDLGEKPHKSLAELAKIHGSLLCLKLGQVTTIVISSADLAQQVLQKHDQICSDRTVVDAVRALQHHQTSMVWLPVSGPWRNLRKICNTHIFTTQKLDANKNLRAKKIQDLLSDVEESCLLGKAVQIGQLGYKSTLNALSSSLFSMDNLMDSDTSEEFKEVTRRIMDEAGKPNLSDYFPVLSLFDVQRIRRRMSSYFQRFCDMFDCVIDQRLMLRKADDYVSGGDMLDTLLTLSEENSEDMDANRIKHLFLDLFGAGTDTTSSTLEWAMAELLRNPGTLSRARRELETIISNGNALDESDIDKLPYLQAVIKETLRLHPPVPLLLPRKACANVELLGFTIPKGAQVLVNVWAIGRDSSSWKDPNSFIPERFLDSNIDVKGVNFELLPFGSGRRICPGLPLAMRLLPLMLGTLVNNFDWKLEDGVAPEDLEMDDRFGLTLQMSRPLRAVPIKL